MNEYKFEDIADFFNKNGKVISYFCEYMNEHPELQEREPYKTCCRKLGLVYAEIISFSIMIEKMAFIKGDKK